MIVSGHEIPNRVHDGNTQYGSPKSLHSDQQQRRRRHVHLHDMFLEHELHGLNERPGHQEAHPEEGLRRGRGGVVLLAGRGGQERRASHDDDADDIPEYADPVKFLQMFLHDMLFHQCHENDPRSSQHLIYGNVQVLQSHHAERRGRQIENGRNGQEEIHPSGNFPVIIIIIAAARGTLRTFRRRNERRLFRRNFHVSNTTNNFTTFRHIVIILVVVIVSREWNSKCQYEPMHDQTEEHADEHAKGLE
mmetsp:Transcript_36811/g.79463  ORF Transcript_36811/g.79463 Transcript_36811/m.79463 type:complete len:248 (+) Transcript_36811:708-1451(+)